LNQPIALDKVRKQHEDDVSAAACALGNVDGTDKATESGLGSDVGSRNDTIAWDKTWYYEDKFIDEIASLTLDYDESLAPAAAGNRWHGEPRTGWIALEPSPKIG
jgi:hypothetical protein